MVKTYKEIETKNGFKYHFYDEENILICSIFEDGTTADINRELTENEKEYIKEISNAEIK